MPRVTPRQDNAGDVAQQIRDRLSVRQLAEQLYPGHNFRKNPCESPWVEQKTGSFSIFSNEQEFNDFATGDKGDVFDFWRIAKGVDAKQAFKDLKEMVFGSGTISPAPIIRAPRVEQPKERIRPSLRVPTPEEVKCIGRLRSIDPDALQLAVVRGLLHTCTSVQYGECFVVTDSTGRNDRVRKLSGEPMLPDVKAICTPGSQANWPIGITEAQDFPAIALCEGEGDFLAAFGFIHAYGASERVAPVCMGGAMVSIAPEAINMFKGKRVRVFMQADSAGQKARDKWVQQIFNVARTIDSFDFAGYKQQDGTVVFDLNDLLRIHPDSFEQNRDEVESIMKF